MLTLVQRGLCAEGDACHKHQHTRILSPKPRATRVPVAMAFNCFASYPADAKPIQATTSPIFLVP